MPRLADFYVLQKPRPKADGGGFLPLGSRDDVIRFFATVNTTADRPGTDVLHGPGIRVELPPAQDPVQQLTINVTEDELFEILFTGTSIEPMGRLLRAALARGWRFFDPVRSEYVPPYHDGDDDGDDPSFGAGSDDDD